MHLAVDCVGINDGGGATVALDFLQAALRDRRIERLTVFSSPLDVLTIVYPTDPKLHVIIQPRAYASRLSRLAWQVRQLGTACRHHGADRLLCLANAGEAPPGLPCATFIQQSLPFSPEALATLSTRRRLEMLILRRMMRRSCRRAQRVLVQTDVMARWLAAAFDLPAPKVSVIEPAAPSPGSAPPSPLLAAMRAASPGLRLLYVGSDAPYKMVSTLIHSLPLVQARLPGVQLFLTLPTEHAVHHPPDVTCLGYLAPAALYEAYRLASVLLMPSLVETVGLPMLEAFSVGTPVVAAD
ncbi:MAG: glycosyltransferase, partial [Anaerolineae bacterium]|nr:glycosyltransferase [Anaerolineae bacterium]